MPPFMVITLICNNPGMKVWLYVIMVVLNVNYLIRG